MRGSPPKGILRYGIRSISRDSLRTAPHYSRRQRTSAAAVIFIRRMPSAQSRPRLPRVRAWNPRNERLLPDGPNTARPPPVLGRTSWALSTASEGTPGLLPIAQRA